MTQTAPAIFKVKFATSEGDFVVESQREWAPLGVDRFYNLVKNGYYDGVCFSCDLRLHGPVRHPW